MNDVRADGFHEVQTILQAIDLSDGVTGEARRGPFQIACATPGVPIDGSNLLWKAAQRLWESAGREGPARNALVTLDKRIPMQAGLGGGSSDAAAALQVLRRVWKLKVADEQLHTIATEIGSDVSYFLVGGTALGLGRGEEIYPLEDLQRLWVVLAIPPFGVATADAYAWLDELRSRSPGTPEPGYLPGTWLGRTVPLANDLEPPVIERHPLIGRVKARLMKLGAVMAGMSGSGSTVFGVFTTARAAKSCVAPLRRSGVDVLCARFLPRS